MEENTSISDPDMLLYDLTLISSNEDLVIFFEIKILNTPPPPSIPFSTSLNFMPPSSPILF